MSRLKYQGDCINGQTIPICQMFVRNHPIDYLAASSICFGCGDIGHKLRHCSWVDKNDKYSHR